MGIKSFQGATVPVDKNKNQAQLKVADYMSIKLTTFRPEDSILQVMENLIKNRISGGPVLNNTGTLVGMISEGDCMKQISECRYYNQPLGDLKVKDFMASPVDTLEADTSIFDAAAIFHKSQRKRFPILENGVLVGQISRRDILRAALYLKSQNWK